MECCQHTVNGDICVNWHKQGKSIKLSIVVPFGSTAEIVLPNSVVMTNTDSLTVGSGQYDYMLNIAD